MGNGEIKLDSFSDVGKDEKTKKKLTFVQLFRDRAEQN